MALTAAEKMRRSRAKRNSDPQKRQQYLEKERVRSRQRYEPVSCLSQKKMNKRRVNWKKASKDYRERQKSGPQVNTPPCSDEELNIQEVSASSSNATRGRKKVRREKAKVYRDNAILKVKLSNATKTAEKYRKQAERSRKLGLTETPRRKTNKLLRGSSVSAEVKKTLLFHNCLMSEINKTTAECTTEAEKQISSKIIGGKIFKRYRVTKFAKESGLMISWKRMKSNQRKSETPNFIYERKAQINALGENTKEQIVAFYERDDNSRISTNKKDTITRKKLKKQKRFLLDSMRSLHVKFCSETNLDVRVGYTSFTKLKPFWVVIPTAADRDTCLCKLHDNLQLKADRLHSLGVISESRLEDVIQYVVCDNKRKECMFRECDQCEGANIVFSDSVADTMDIWWWQWCIVKESLPRQPEKTVTKTVKSKVMGTLKELKSMFQDEIKDNLCPHVYTIQHQYHKYRHVRDELLREGDEALIHIDFSENYSCKYAQEIQAVHFGASHQQATLHTGILYFKDGEHISFCSISDSTRHDPSAIWAHLDPVLNIAYNSGIRTIHFYSDGPTTQYRNKTNFWFFSSYLHERGFHGGTWNFFEAGHGKGAADGIGGVIKRRADRLVANGIDLPDATTLYNNLVEETSVIKLFFIPLAAIEDKDSKIPGNLISIKGTMKLHQLFTDDVGHLICKDLSCFCTWPTPCSCYDRTIVDIVNEQEQHNNEVPVRDSTEGEIENQDSNITSENPNVHSPVMQVTTESNQQNDTVIPEHSGINSVVQQEISENPPQEVTKRRRGRPKGVVKKQQKVQENTDWYCFICAECTMIAMIMCCKCQKWVHEQCANLEIMQDNYTCDFCLK